MKRRSLIVKPNSFLVRGNTRKPSNSQQQSLSIRKEILGENDPDYATSLNNLAALYRSMGDYAKSEPLYKQALAIRKEVLGEKDPAYASSLNNLARCTTAWEITTRQSRSISRRWRSARKF